MSLSRQAGTQKLQSPLASAAYVMQVGDQSDFVNVLGRVLKDAGPRLGAALSDVHYRCRCWSSPRTVSIRMRVNVYSMPACTVVARLCCVRPCHASRGLHSLWRRPGTDQQRLRRNDVTERPRS